MNTHSGSDMIAQLVTDHDEVRGIFSQLRPAGESAPGAGPVRSPVAHESEREDLVRLMTVGLVQHSVAEEVYLYPLIREVLPDGDQIANHEISEHAEVEQLLKNLEDLKPGEPAYNATIAKVIDDVTHHAQDEEDNLFPQLREHCSPEQLQELGDKVRTIKKIAPTHPHPSAPDTPPGNMLAGPMAGIVDRVRDALTGRSK